MIFFSLGFIMNLFEEINFFKDFDVGIYLPIELSTPIFLGGMIAHYASRKKRYCGSSKAKLSFLIKHSLNIISVFRSDVQRNSLIFCLILFLIFLYLKMLIIFVAIVIIIIFNISIYYQSKQIYNFHNCLNLIKHIKKY